MNPLANPQVRLPAEWEHQDAVLLTWPHPESDWSGNLDEAEACFADIAATISRYQTVVIASDRRCRDPLSRIQAARSEPRPERIRTLAVDSNDSWARDHGPITVYRDGRSVVLDFRFNGWGGKYRHDLDDRIASGLAECGLFGPATFERVEFVLEGGAIDTDGDGTILTTTRCLLAPTRNGVLDRAQAEAVLRERLGARRVLWLENGAIPGDDTDGHIDTLARFAGPDTLVHQAAPADSDGSHPLRAMERELAGFRRPDGEAYERVPLPAPRPVRNEAGEELPATYANFLVINHAVLVPAYGDPADEEARRILAHLFPDRKAISIDCRPLIRQFGSLHCVTMQFPAATLDEIDERTS